MNCPMIPARSSVFEFPLHLRSLQRRGIAVSPVQTLSVSIFISFSRLSQFVLSSAKTMGSFGFILAMDRTSSATFLKSSISSSKNRCNRRTFDFGRAFPGILFAILASSTEFNPMTAAMIAMRQTTRALFRFSAFWNSGVICISFLWDMVFLSPGVPVKSG